MDHLIIIMAFFALLGLFDDLFGGKLGLAKDFDQGLATMGRLVLATVGFYCIGISFIQNHADAIAELTSGMPFDPSLAIGSLLCADVGGLPLAMEVARDPTIGIYTGALVGGGLGMIIGFQLPIFLSALDRSYFPVLMKGIICGLVTLPVGLLAGGLWMGLSMNVWLVNTIPVLILCAVLVLAFFLVPHGTIKLLTFLGLAIRILSYGLFAAVLVGLFLPDIAMTERALVEEILYIDLRTVTVACGGLVLSNLAIRYFPGPFEYAAKLLGVNSEAVIGLIISCFQGMAMLPLFPKMNRRGKIMNAAFAVCGAYMLGGQMAYVSHLIPAQYMPGYMANKLIAGVLAVALGLIIERETAASSASHTNKSHTPA